MNLINYLLLIILILPSLMFSSQVIRFNTQKGPQAIGPYSTVSIYGKVAYVSGQIGLDPKSG